MAWELRFRPALGRFSLEAYEPGEPGPGEVRSETILAAPKHGTELRLWQGGGFRGRRWDARLRLFLDPEPVTAAAPESLPVGNMGVATITGVGPGVRDLAPGDRVYGYMPVREVQLLPAAGLRPLGRLSPEDAVCIDPAHVAFVAVRDGAIRLGDTVAVFGLGAIGLLAVQAARASGALRVIGVDPLAPRRARALALGADAVRDPGDGDVALAIKQLTGDAGVDVALEVSGTDASLRQAIRCLRQCGTVVAVAWGHGDGRGLYLGEEFHVNRPTVVASQAVWDNPDRDHPRWNAERAQAACAELFLTGRLTSRGVLDPVVSLQEAPGVLDAILHDPGRVLKVGVRFA
jgi:threonine dehydrogenase-like Zn-dependent dehydrogenase